MTDQTARTYDRLFERLAQAHGYMTTARTLARVLPELELVERELGQALEHLQAAIDAGIDAEKRARARARARGAG